MELSSRNYRELFRRHALEDPIIKEAVASHKLKKPHERKLREQVLTEEQQTAKEEAFERIAARRR